MTATLEINKKENKKHFTLSMKSINKAILIVFIFNVVFIPNDTFNLKIISLLLLLLCNFNLFLSPKTLDEKVICCFGLGLTSFTILWSLILTVNINNIALGYGGYILLLYCIIKKYEIDLKRILLTILKLLAYFLVIMALLDLTHILDMYNNKMLMWFQNSSNALIGKGPHLPIYYMLFFKTSPLLFFSLYDCFQNKKWFSGIIVISAILLSGTRANIFLLAFAITFYFCLLYPRRKVRLLCCFVFAVLALLIIADGRIIKFVLDMFVRKASSDAVREGHIYGLLEYWKANPINFLIGSGYSSQFYSYGINAMASSIELSYWNLLRQVGLILFIFFGIMYLFPALKLFKNREQRPIIFAYLFYLIIAYTNPLLYTSTGVTALLFMYYMCFLNKNLVRN